MFKKFSYFGVFCIVVINAAGCTNAPTPTHADIPLVHSSLSYSLTPEEQAINIPKVNLHNDKQTPLSIEINGTQYESTKYYVSATGNKCIRFASTKEKHNALDSVKVMTTCQRDGQWRVIAPLVASSSQKG